MASEAPSPSVASKASKFQTLEKQNSAPTGKPIIKKKVVGGKKWEVTGHGGGLAREGAYKKNPNPTKKVIYEDLPPKRSLADLP